MAEPVSKCGACGQADDHPKHQIHVGANPAGNVFHALDYAHDGCVYFHFDCPAQLVPGGVDWNDLTARLGEHEDEAANEERQATAAHHARIVALAKSGVRGDDLRARITGGDV